MRRRRKRGHRVVGEWVLGGVERLDPETDNEFEKEVQPEGIKVRKGCKHKAGRMFAVVVPDRSAETLLPILKRKILPGTNIVSDKWKAYAKIEDIDDRFFQHETVNHSKHFVDPESGACTNVIEGAWRAQLKSQISARYYTSGQLEGHLLKRMWMIKNQATLWASIWSLLSNINDVNDAYDRSTRRALRAKTK